MSGRFSFPLVTEYPDAVAALVLVAPVGVPRYLEDLKLVSCPVLVMWGENDKLIPVEQADQLVSAVGRGEKLVLPGAGHAAYMEKTPEFHTALLRFLARVAPQHEAR